ncbi:MAG TPA: alpha/beta hydrolase [Acidimicrobiales bacterium]
MPTIALVHGAFAESASWDAVIDRLYEAPARAGGEHQGIGDVVAIANPLRSLSGDAAYVRDVLHAIDGPIVLVAHSYGGMVISEAAATTDSVVAVVYVGAFAPEHGESAFGLSTMFPGSSLGDALMAYPVADGGDELVIRHELYRDQFAADVPVAQATRMAATQRPVTLAALSEGLATETPVWKRVPSWFVFGGDDRNIPAALERFFAERAQSKGTHEIAGASHALSVSQPDAVAATILDAVEATTFDRDR